MSAAGSTINMKPVLQCLQQYGLALLPASFLDNTTLDAMRCEAAALLEQAQAQQCCSGGDLEDVQQLAEQRGCIFQVLPELAPGHAARADTAAYFKQRNSWPCCCGVTSFLQSRQLMQLLQAALGSTAVLLYNEQYIIKPPCSSKSAFRWHYDSEQCSAQLGVQYSPYLSLWKALDDMTAENGCLMVLPGSRANKQSTSSDNSDKVSCSLAGTAGQQQQTLVAEGVQFVQADSTEALLAQLEHPQEQLASRTAAKSSAVSAGAPSGGGCLQDTNGSCHCCSRLPGTGRAVALEVPAGTAVLLSDDVWHCSGPNTSCHSRTAYMAQFSSMPLAWRASAQLVGLAVPLCTAAPHTL